MTNSTGFPGMNILKLIFTILVSITIISCGESDLKELQIAEIENAQREINQNPSLGEAIENPATGGDTDDVEALLADFSLIFQDEFGASTLDDAKWSTQYLWGPDETINDELQYYVDTLNDPDFGYDPFVFDGQSLSITASETSQDMLAGANNRSYLSGVMTTLDKFSFTFGYIEVRAKVPTGKGLWPGVWMLSEQFVDKKPQLFVMENRGDNLQSVYHRYNYSDDNGELQYSDLLRSTGENFNLGFHTYGVHWEPGKLTFYVDGTEQHSFENDGVSEQAMYIILDMAVGGWFPDSPDENTEFPAEFVIDYVRVYQKN